MPNCHTKPPTLLHGYLPNIFSIWLSYQFTYYYLTKNFTFRNKSTIQVYIKIQFINLYKYRFYLFLFFQPIFSSVYNIFSTDYSNIIFLSFHISITYVESSIFFWFFGYPLYIVNMIQNNKRSRIISGKIKHFFLAYHFVESCTTSVMKA